MTIKALRTLALSSVAALTLLLGACAVAPVPATLADTLALNPQLSTFNRLLEQAELKATLQAAGPMTVFAPNDEAFKAVPAKTLEALVKDKEQLKSVLSFHILASQLKAADVKNGNVKTLQGAELALGRAGDFVTVEDGMVQQADIKASNGVAHIVDRVLMPPKKK
ncbi:fasciclin domain-containing protein [Roseateles oligotrophus]|uniref:Fasciclin domain-containing protein n=1 Tax=Roseateles oligotrophus TaxID=1769250 RepID=A0ABT2YLL3_9BURK|nr:fasciclin domain-containing protein [Roseateles oligotrophus]MCV2370816.1 fasciclin domain-containing protein [Roseateles oligotrophus]